MLISYMLEQERGDTGALAPGLAVLGSVPW
jgi:hypothetical protein